MSNSVYATNAGARDPLTIFISGRPGGTPENVGGGAGFRCGGSISHAFATKFGLPFF
jgi:hypothetical protein